MTPPDPLVPAEVDLRGLDYMPFLGNHLFGSEFNAVCSDAEWRAGVTLWWAAWNQHPAGSLPNDDIALCRLADLGRDLKLWRKLKANALRGFVLCSDGKLYHTFLCKQVLIAWEKRVKEREKKRKWREGKLGDKTGSRPGQDGGHQPNVTGTGTGTDEGTERLTGRDVTGRDEVPSKYPHHEHTTSPDADPPQSRAPSSPVELQTATMCGAMARILRDEGVDVTPHHPTLMAWVAAGVTIQLAREAVDIARVNKPKPQRIPAKYLDPIIAELRGQNGRAHSSMVKAKPWFIDTWTALEAKAKELNVVQTDGEHPQAFRRRVLEAAGVSDDDIKKADAEWR